MGDAKSTQPDVVESTEEEPVHLPCNHPTISGTEYIHWYRQIPGQGPEYVIQGLKGNVSHGMTSLIIATDRKSSTLILAQVTLRDSAAYYCILRDTQWDGGGCTCTISPWWGRGTATPSKETTAQECAEKPDRRKSEEKIVKKSNSNG
ncbi:hypothetical protein PAL_GLEAN10000332 [Pteropus alecto]|uniref:Ig-like domain-containing protein n=1 Tax=Pteropus alecto TaxID=9402 RepID=L5KAF0_PTEAL|nr:hypothetical protein PAL_GLEAN10000332 [Pteropus alecto]